MADVNLKISIRKRWIFQCGVFGSLFVLLGLKVGLPFWWFVDLSVD